MNNSLIDTIPLCFLCSCQDLTIKKDLLIFHLEIDDGTGIIDCLFLDSVAERLLHTKIDLIENIKDTPDFKRFMDKLYSLLLGKDIYIKGKVDIDEELRESIKKMANNMELQLFAFKIRCLC